MKDIAKMRSQIQNNRRRSIVIALLAGGPLSVWAQPLLADGPAVKGNAKQVPSYVAAHFDKPKVRSVHANKAIVRSGPAEKYYATSTLLNGAAVDVYMETSDGWSGIRPPAGSHDWIPSNIAYLLPGGKSAEIIEDKSPAWVGSDLTDVSDFMWQMELAKSQLVQVLGEELQMTEDGGKLLWYRIAPPQGEFRWVKTSQLSDSPKSSLNDGSVQLANYLQDAMPSQQTVKPSQQSGKLSQQSGKVVWSDEKQALDQMEQQIQREQAEIQGKMAADGVHVKIHSPTLDVQARGNSSRLVSNASDITDSEPEAIVMDSVMDSEESGSPSSTSTRIRPIAASPNHKKTIGKAISTDHQIDGQRQWEAMQSTDPTLRIRPIRSLLGLIGFSIIEADRDPATTRIAQEYHSNLSQGNIGRIGPVGNSRLDRLPRPGQHGPGQHGPSMTLPPDASTTFGSTMGMNASGPASYGAPIHQGETTFSRWLNSHEPVFGSTPNGMNNTASMNNTVGVNNTASMNSMTQSTAAGYPNAVPSQVFPVALDTTAWHGLNPALRSLESQSFPDSLNAELSSNQQDPEEFRTPEIQSALVQLTRQVAGPTEEWNFSALRNQAAGWVENGATAMVRGESRLLVERIERFESLRQRTLGLAQDSSLIAQQSSGNATTAAIRQANNVTPASATGVGANGNMVSSAVGTSPMMEGDASGWLVQVHTSIRGQPEFALTDDAGKVITYVQSTASLNLRRYLQQPVTVYGVRGYIPNLAAKQILAERVVRMR